jgi:hypothetical protein
MARANPQGLIARGMDGLFGRFWDRHEESPAIEGPHHERWPANATPFVSRFYGEPPMVRAAVHAVDLQYAKFGLSPASSGRRRTEPSNAYTGASWRGYEPGIQDFSSGLLTPSQANIRAGLNQLLPGTVGLPGDAAPPATTPGGPKDLQSMLPGAPL